MRYEKLNLFKIRLKALYIQFEYCGTFFLRKKWNSFFCCKNAKLTVGSGYQLNFLVVSQGSRKVGTCSPPICDFGSHFWLASWNSFRNKCLLAKMSYRKWRLPAKLVKNPKKYAKKTHSNRDNYFENYKCMAFCIILYTAYVSHFW